MVPTTDSKFVWAPKSSHQTSFPLAQHPSPIRLIPSRTVWNHERGRLPASVTAHLPLLRQVPLPYLCVEREHLPSPVPGPFSSMARCSAAGATIHPRSPCPLSRLHQDKAGHWLTLLAFSSPSGRSGPLEKEQGGHRRGGRDGAVGLCTH